MKFGHNLPRNQVPEWAASYINYKGLKKLIKNAAEASKDGSAPDLAGKFTLPCIELHFEYLYGSGAIITPFDMLKWSRASATSIVAWCRNSLNMANIYL
jgi:hypothetical protein